MTDEVKRKMKDYGVTSVPTVIIDGDIKVVGIPDFPWICGYQNQDSFFASFCISL
jgi:protein-disulfide isomerase